MPETKAPTRVPRLLTRSASVCAWTHGQQLSRKDQDRLPQRSPVTSREVLGLSLIHSFREVCTVIRILRRFAPVLALAFVFAIAVSAYAIDAKGKVKSVAADKNEFVMTDDTGKNWTITVGKDAKIFVNDKEAKLADLQADDMVQISYERDGQKLVASAVKSTRK